jgi:hypothetical protein
MSDRYRCREGLPHPATEMFTQVGPVVAGGAAGIPWGLECGSSLSGGQINLRLQTTTARMGGRAADATCPV